MVGVIHSTISEKKRNSVIRMTYMHMIFYVNILFPSTNTRLSLTCCISRLGGQVARSVCTDRFPQNRRTDGMAEHEGEL